ncbi:hypothetical protein KXR53_13125 [Inquilinus limosus]|uniref:hypothetical protein n=1 Tax=Inquilinus limosus TaxID=171674 RepID=UPI003F161150
MRIPLRFTRFWFGGIVALVMITFFTNYKNFNLDEWLPFTKTASGSLIFHLASLIFVFLFLYFFMRHAQELGEIPRKSKILFRSTFYLLSIIFALTLSLLLIVLVAG